MGFPGFALLLAVPFTRAIDVRADAYSSAVTADHPAAYFRLSETNGSYFSVDNAHTGTVVGSVTRGLIGPGPRVDALRQTRLFDGLDLDNVGPVFANGTNNTLVTQAISVPNATALNAGTGSITLEGWVNRPVVPPVANNGMIFSKMGYSGNNARMGYTLATITDAGGVMSLQASLRYTNDIFASPSATMTTGVWYHVAAVFDRSGEEDTATLYVNGAAQGTTTSAVLRAGDAPGGARENIQSTVALGIGATMTYTGGSQWYGISGRVDEVAFYTNALTAEQISSHYAAARGSLRGTSTPPVTNGLLVAVQGRSAITSSTARVGVWVDEAPLGGYQDFLQPTEANRPTGTNVLMPKGRPASVLNFAMGGTNYLELGATPAMDTNTWTWFAVFKPNPASAGMTRVALRSAYTSGAGASSSSIWGSYLHQTQGFLAQTRQSGGTAVIASFVPAVSNQWFILSAAWNGTGSDLNGNPATTLLGRLQDELRTVYGESTANNATATPLGHVRTRIGANSDISSSPYPFDGMIAEILIYSTLLSPSDISAVETHLIRKYLAQQCGSGFTIR